MIPLLPIAAASTLGLGYTIFKVRKVERLKGVMTPIRERIYLEALNSLRAADDLKQLADAFRGEGLLEQADLLGKRAAIKELPEPVRKARRAIVKQALTWKDPEKVNALAKAYDDVGANGAAALLRRYAAGLLPTDTQSAPAVRRRRRSQQEIDMSQINPFPQAPIPGALNPNPPAPEPGAIPTPLNNPGMTPETPETPGEALPPIDPDTGETPAINPEDPNVNITVEESDDPSEPAQVTVESDDPEHTDVQVTETDD